MTNQNSKMVIINKWWGYALELPTGYDPAMVTREDARRDGEIRVLTIEQYERAVESMTSAADPDKAWERLNAEADTRLENQPKSDDWTR